MMEIDAVEPIYLENAWWENEAYLYMTHLDYLIQEFEFEKDLDIEMEIAMSGLSHDEWMVKTQTKKRAEQRRKARKVEKKLKRVKRAGAALKNVGFAKVVEKLCESVKKVSMYANLLTKAQRVVIDEIYDNSDSD